jgi:ADP-heptose:LPS heptosyltransferase
MPDCSVAPKSFLFIKLAEQGAIVVAYAAIRRAVEIAGRENVYFLASGENRAVIEVLEVIPKENILVMSVGSIRGLLRSALSLVRRLRRARIEAAIDLEFFSRGTAALAYLSGARRRAGLHAFHGAGPYRGDLMTHRVLYNPHLHASEAFLALVEAALEDPARLPALDNMLPNTPAVPPLFVPSREELARVQGFLGTDTADQRRIILLNPNTSDLLPLRRWPTERYVELGRRLLEKYPDFLIAFTGSPEETGAVGELVRQVSSDRCILVAGKTTLRELLALYTLAEVLVTNDSGPAHFATLTPVRVVTLFGPETPEVFAARTSRNTVLWARLRCSPCVSALNSRCSPCRDNRCMQAISVDDVLQAVVQNVRKDVKAASCLRFAAHKSEST